MKPLSRVAVRKALGAAMGPGEAAANLGIVYRDLWRYCSLTLDLEIRKLFAECQKRYTPGRYKDAGE